MLHTGVGSTLLAWYACMVELASRYERMDATPVLCYFVLHLVGSRTLLVLVCLPAAPLVTRCPCPFLAVARARMSTRRAAGCPYLSA